MATTTQIGIFLVFLACVIYEADALMCYKCSSHYDDWCYDDFDKTTAPAPIDCNQWARQQKLEEKPDACIKYVQKVHRIIKGKWFKPVVLTNITTRGCGFSRNGKGCTPLQGAQTFGNACHCDRDRCNAAGSVHMTFTFVLSMVAAIFAAVKYLRV